MSEHEKSGVQSVQRALQLLSMFAPHRLSQLQHRTSWSVSELARATGLHKSIVARMMATMASEGYLVQDSGTRQYSVGPQAFAVGLGYKPYTARSSVARPSMEALTQEVGHASYLGVPAGAHYLLLLATESRVSVRVKIEMGERRRFHSGAIGKILLASMTDEAIRATIGSDPLPQLTPYTIASGEELSVQIAEVRKTGIAFASQEAILGASSIAVAISNTLGEVVAGLGLIYPSHLVSEAELQVLITHTRRAGDEISRRIGWGI